MEANEQRYRRILQNIDEIVYSVITTKDAPFGGIIEFVSPQIERITGHRPEEFMADPHLWFHLIHPEDIPGVERVTRRIFSGLEVGTREYRLQCKNSATYRWVEDRIVLQRDAAGEVSGIFGVARDVTEAKQTHEHLQKLSSAVEQTADNIFVTNRQGSIEYVNPAFEQFTGYTQEEAIGHTPAILKSGQHTDEFYKRLWGTILGRKAFRATFINKKKNGELYYEEKTITPIRDDQGTITHFVSTGKDMTERRRAEIAESKQQALVEALEKEKELNALKSQFVSMVSHEFRTPMSIILMSCSILNNYRGKYSDEQRQTEMNKIETAIQRMTSMIDEVLLTSKGEVGALKFQPMPVNLTKFCSELAEEIVMASKETHHIAFSAQGECSNVLVDVDLLRQVLGNLLNNATKYSPVGSTVYFELDCRTETLVFEVRDQGVGIPPADQEHIFEPFHRGSNVARVYGTGLGLRIAKQAVERHGGTISFKSQLEVGTSFTVRIPLTQKDENSEVTNVLD